MTSRVSFLKLVKETLRQHISAVLITILVFVIHIIAFFLNVQNALSIANGPLVAETLQELTSSTNILQEKRALEIAEAITDLSYPNTINGVIAMLVGVYLAFDFLRYLHSKKETDFYDSLPIRKEKWFAVILVSCVSLFTLCSVLTTGVELAIIYSVGYGSALILQNMLWNLLCMIGIFLACWFTAALSMIMTGHSIIALLGMGAFASYIPLILYYLVPVYAGKYFTTYVGQRTTLFQYYFSPVTLMYKTMNNLNNWEIANHWTYLLGCFIFAVIVGLISYYLFLRRPSEAAGRAMSFEKINCCIRFLIVIPLALYIGIFLSEMSSFADTAWLIFGVIFGAFLIHGIIECIFQFDIKALIRKKRQLIIEIILCLGFVFIFLFDVFNYDEYIPEESDVKSVFIDAYEFDNNYNDFDEFNDGISGEKVKDALLVIQDIMNASTNEYSDYFCTFNVEYHLKNGQTRRRCYSYTQKELPKSLENLYATEDFKNDFCVLYHSDKIDVKSISINNGVESFNLELSQKEWDDFVEKYLKEHMNLKLSYALEHEVVYEIELSFSQKNDDYIHNCYYNIYPDFKETIEFLKERNVVTFAETNSIVLENLEIYGEKFDNDYSQERYVTDLDLLNALKEYMIVGVFMFDDYGNEYTYCDLRYQYNNAIRYTSVFIKNTILKSLLDKN